MIPCLDTDVYMYNINHGNCHRTYLQHFPDLYSNTEKIELEGKIFELTGQSLHGWFGNFEFPQSQRKNLYAKQRGFISRKTSCYLRVYNSLTS